MKAYPDNLDRPIFCLIRTKFVWTKVSE